MTEDPISGEDLLVLTRADVMLLFDGAIEREDFERAEEFANILLRRNDPEEACP